MDKGSPLTVAGAAPELLHDMQLTVFSLSPPDFAVWQDLDIYIW